MKLLDRVKAAYRAITLADFPALTGMLETRRVAAGVAVTEATALTNSAFWAGVNMIASQIGALPRVVYKRQGDDERKKATTHPAYRLLHGQPNANMTDVVLWETMLAHALTWGNAYAEIEWDKATRPIGLWPITPDVIYPAIEGGKLVYVYRGAKKIDPTDMLHIPGLGFDGLKGYSVVAMARESLGLAMAAEKFGATLFGNGAWPGIVLEHPKNLTEPAQARLRTAWNNLHQGPDRAHGLAILEEGMKAQKIGIPPEDAQFLETRQFQVEEVARWLNINPAKLKLKVGERPGGNLETSQIEFLTDTLRPWLVRIEQELNRKLFPANQQGTYYVEHTVDAILRMDGKSRAESYKAYFDMGVLSADQIAKKENLPKPEPKPEPAPAPAAPVPAPAAADPEPAKNGRMLQAQRALVVEVVGRFVRREAAQVKHAVKKGPAGLSAWLEEFYMVEAPRLRGYLMAPVGIALAHAGLDGDAGAIAGELARGYIEQSRDELLALPARNMEAAAEGLVTAWESSRPIEVAERLQEMDLEGTK